MASRNYIKKSYIRTTLRKLIDSFNPARPIIYGKLSVAPGHDYWWFLEYGTGQYFEDPSESSITVRPPAAAASEEPGGAYDIEVKDAKVLVYINNAGDWHFQTTTHHPGVQPIAIVRSALFSAHLYLKDVIKPVRERSKRKNWGYLPTRKELVDLVNSVMLHLLEELRASTPVDNDPNPYHEGRHFEPLRDAWKVTKAR